MTAPRETTACPCFANHHSHAGHCCLDGLPDDCGQGAALPCGHRYGGEGTRTPETAPRPADRQPGGSTGVVCPIGAPHGPHGIQTFIAGGEPGPVPLLSARWCPGSDVTTCEACPFLGCRGCEAEAARRANGEAK